MLRALTLPAQCKGGQWLPTILPQRRITLISQKLPGNDVNEISNLHTVFLLWDKSTGHVPSLPL